MTLYAFVSIPNQYKYRKSSIKPPGGAYLISDLPERGAYSQNQVIRIYFIAFQFLYLIFCGINIQLYGSNT